MLKKIIYFQGSVCVFLCIFENDTAKSDCPIQDNYEIFKDLIQIVGVYLTSFTVFYGDIKKSSENDQSTCHFQSFFSFFFLPSTLNLNVFPVN